MIIRKIRNFVFIFCVLALSCYSSKIYAENIISTMPLDEAIQDVIAITTIQNLPEERAKYSNKIFELKEVKFDEKNLTVNYTFEFKLKDSKEEFDKFFNDFRNFTIASDCSTSNFAHGEITNRYVFINYQKEIIGEITTSQKYCENRNRNLIYK